MSLKQKSSRLARQGFKTRRDTIAKSRWMPRRNIGRRQARVGAKTPKCGEWHAKLHFSLLMRFVSYVARDAIYADMDN